MDVSALREDQEADLDDIEESVKEAAPAEGGGSGVYRALRDHAKELVALVDQIAEDAKAEGGLHDKPAELLAVILMQARSVADLVEILADFEEEEDKEDAAGGGEVHEEIADAIVEEKARSAEEFAK